jgi:hypothetical protein
VLGLLGLLDFLNSREKAVTLWAIALFVFAAAKREGVVSSLLGVVGALVHPKLLLLFGSAALYCSAVVVLAMRGGIWHTTAVKETVYWFVASGLVLVGKATQASPHDPTYFKNLLRQALRVTLIVEFLVALYVFPFGVELVFVPVVALFVAMQVVASYDPAMEDARKVIDGVLILIGAGLMLYVTVSAITDLGALLTRENAEHFLLVPSLSLAFAPFLYIVAWRSRSELDNLQRQRATAFDSA